jgi:ABC-2 type transport system permease protein
MRATLSLFRREFSAYFLSPIAYVVLTFFLILTGIFFFFTVDQLTTDGPEGIRFPMQMMFGSVFFWLVFLFIPAFLTMRLFAEERSTGTLEVLMTAPLHDWQVVLCKYLAAFTFYLLMWVPTLVYLPPILLASEVNALPVLSSYLGVVLVGAMFLALGLFVSNLVRSQIVAAVITLALGLVFTIGGIWIVRLDTGGLLYQLLSFVTVPYHFERDFSRGVIDTRHIILYLTLAALFVFLTVRSLESRRWR